MPQYSTCLEIPRPVAEVFDFLARPANLVQLAPPDLNLQLVQAPERLQLGALLHWKGRRMGVSHALVQEVTAFEETCLIEEQQRQGPFKRWLLVHRFDALESGTRIVEELTYEPPGGLLGLLLRAEAVHREVENLFAYRAQKLRVLLG